MAMMARCRVRRKGGPSPGLRPPHEPLGYPAIVSFHEREYAVFAVLGDPAAPPLWSWPAWQQTVPILAPLVVQARGEAALRTTQYADREVIRFGRIGWNAAGHRKWTHGSPDTAPVSSGWQFLDVELWAPSWTACEREDRAPDVFLSVGNEQLGAGFGKALAFNPRLLLAAASDTPGLADAAATVARALAALVQARLAARASRPWGRTAGIGFTDAIQDLGASGLFVPGSRHTRAVDLSTLAGRWEGLLPSARGV